MKGEVILSQDKTLHGGRRRALGLRVGVVLTSVTLVVAGLSVVSAGASGSQAAALDDGAKVVCAGTPVGLDLDPYKAGGTLVGIVDMYDGLIRPTVDLKLTPSLATAWKYSADNLKLTLTLREGVKFADGTPFDSSAVVASLNRARSGATSQQKVALASVSNVTAVDAKTVDVTLSKPDATVLNVLSTPAGFIINPKMITDDAAIRAGKVGVGTGAYTLDQFLVGNKMILNRNDSYWDPAAVKHAPKVFEYDVVSDGSARLNGLKSGAYQCVQSTGTPGLNGPGGLPDVDKNYVDTKIPGFSMFGLGFRLDKPPFDNEKVRLAIAHALDFETLVTGVLGDEMNCAAPSDAQVFLKGQIGYDGKLKHLKFDLKAAKALLAEAGYPDGKGFPTVTISSTVASNDVFAGQAFQGMLARIGITNVTLDPQPTRVFVLADFQSGKANAMTSNQTVGGGVDPASGIDGGIVPPPLIDKSATGTQLTDLIAQAKSELDPAKRTGIYKQFSKVVNDHAMFIPFCRLRNGYAHVKTVNGFEKSFQALNGVTEARFLTVTKGK